MFKMTESKGQEISIGTVQINCSKGRLSYHLWVECFSQLSFDSEEYTGPPPLTRFLETEKTRVRGKTAL